MTVEELRKACKAQPFRPFTMFIADGRQVFAHNPEYVIVPPVGRTTFVYQKDGTLDIIDLLLVTDHQFQPPAEAAAQST